ncbi:MAG: aminoacyl-tRNA hydrolase [Deltaproteobacteria bacterium]|nr:aminoacyl-tRNA hydrolase [Deltaproteobacteria bacterium]
MSVTGLIFGLGNPGQRYERTRHNLGFMLADRIVSEAPDASVKSRGELHHIWCVNESVTGKSWLVVKPQTYMNLSGESVARVLRRHPVPLDRVLILHDELDLPWGRFRFKAGGGTAGHNGLKSIAHYLGSRDFLRLRMGIDRPPPRWEVTNYVLSKIPPDEEASLSSFLDLAARAVHHFCRHGLDSAMQEFHPLT